MATYGEAGQNTFTFGTGAQQTRPFSIIYNPTTNVSQVYITTGTNIFGVPQVEPVGTINFNTGKRTLIPSTNLSQNEEDIFKTNPYWDDQTKKVISNASPSANANQLLQPRGTQPAPPATGAQGAQGGQNAGGTNTPGSANAGPNNYDPADTVLGAFQNILPELQEGQTPGSYKTWYYPEDLQSSNQDRVYIEQIKYVVPDIDESKNTFAGSLSNRENLFSKEAILGSVTLPITNNLTESTEVSWGEDKLSTIAAGLMAGGVNVADLASEGKFLTALGSFGSTVGGALGNPNIQERIKQIFAARAAAGAIGMLGIQVNPEGYIARRTGTVPNPNLELLFNGPKLRSFGLAFKMVARSEKEAKQIRGIIKFFKKGMAPLRGQDNLNAFFLGAPNVFRVKFKPAEGSNELLSLPTFKTCALVRCEVNYTPDGIYAAYADPNVGSQPVAVTLQLGFAELTPLYNDEYEFPGKNNSVGPDRNLIEDFNTDITTSGSSNPVTPPGPAGQATSPARTLIQGTGQSQPQLGLPPA